MKRRVVLLLASSAVLAACAPINTTVSSVAPTTYTTETTSPTNPPRPVSLRELEDVPGAIAMNVAANTSDGVAVSWIDNDAVLVSTFGVADEELSTPVAVNGDFAPIAHPIERPGLAVRADGTVDVAFTSHIGEGGSVIYTQLRGGVAAEPAAISGEPAPETNLVHFANDRDQVALAWLEDSTLSVAISSSSAAPVEIEGVDDLTCDCCNPAPVFVDDAFIVPFRDYQLIEGEVVRDTASVRSLDGGKTFETTLQIADEHWFLDACPFSGPSAVRVGGTLVVAFMDGRQTVHPEQTSSSIWVDVSRDSGATFGQDLEITGEGINRWPVMAVDDRDRVHLIWEVAGSDGGIAYVRSDDAGASFTEPVLLVSTEEAGRSPRAPSIAHQDEQLIVTWTDELGGHIGIVDLG